MDTKRTLNRYGNCSIMKTKPNQGSPTLIEAPSKVKYALVALLELASNSNQKTPMTSGEIAAKHPIPERYLEQVLINLRQTGLIKSHRGSKGGYVLTRPPWQITLFDVVVSLEGNHIESKSANGEDPTREIIFNIWRQAQLAAIEVLQQQTLDDLCHRRDEHKQQYPTYHI